MSCKWKFCIRLVIPRDLIFDFREFLSSSSPALRFPIPGDSIGALATLSTSILDNMLGCVKQYTQYWVSDIQ